MNINEKLAEWQGWSRTNGGNWINPFTKMTCLEHPDYLNDDAAAMSLLDTVVEKGYWFTLDAGSERYMFNLRLGNFENRHNVPIETIQRMKSNIEDINGEIFV